MLSRGLVQVLKIEDVSSTQYNVLRILRGAPEGLPCGEIASRMITRDPDVTRLLDRLEKRELISRCRETKDRRTVRTRIAPDGLKLLARLDEPVQAAHRKQLGHLGRERLQALAELSARFAAAKWLDLLALIVVATNIGVTHLIATKGTYYERNCYSANRNSPPGTSTRFTPSPSSR